VKTFQSLGGRVLMLVPDHSLTGNDDVHSPDDTPISEPTATPTNFLPAKWTCCCSRSYVVVGRVLLIAWDDVLHCAHAPCEIEQRQQGREEKMGRLPEKVDSTRPSTSCHLISRLLSSEFLSFVAYDSTISFCWTFRSSTWDQHAYRQTTCGRGMGL